MPNAETFRTLTSHAMRPRLHYPRGKARLDGSRVYMVAGGYYILLQLIPTGRALFYRQR